MYPFKENSNDRPRNKEEGNPYENEIIYGIHPVVEALEAGKSIDKIFMLNTLQTPQSKIILTHAKSKKIALARVPLAKLQKLSRHNHQGVIAFIAPIEFADLDTELRKLEIKGVTPFILVLDRISDVRNFGAIIRTAECAGVNFIVIPKKGGANISSETVKTSAGALFNMPICRVAGVDNALDTLVEKGIKLVACTEKDAAPYKGFDYTQPVAVVMGSEESGIAWSNIKKCDYKAGVPLMGKTESLNVSVAAGIVLYEVLSQRNPL